MITPLAVIHPLNVHKLVRLNTHSHRELDILVHCYSPITNLPLIVRQALIQDSHTLEVLPQVVETFQQPLTIWHLFTSNNPLINFKQLLKISITLFDKEELVE